MPRGFIQQSYGNGQYLVRLYFEASERTSVINALTAEIAQLESDRDDMDTDINAAISKVNQLKSEYQSLTQALYQCYANNPLQPLVCGTQSDAVEEKSQELLKASYELGSLRQERSRLSARITEAQAALTDWTLNIKEFEDRVLWSADYPEPGVAIPGPADEVTVIPIQGVKKMPGGHYIPITEYVLHWVTYDATIPDEEKDRLGDDDSLDEKTHDIRNKQFKALRDKPWTAMSAISNLTLATRRDAQYTGKWVIGTVTGIVNDYTMTVLLEGKVTGGSADPDYGAGVVVSAQSQYYNDDHYRVYKPGDRVLCIQQNAEQGTFLQCVGFADNPRRGCRNPQIYIQWGKSLMWVWNYSWATGVQGDCYASDHQAGIWYTTQHVVGLGGVSTPTFTWRNVKFTVLNPTQVVHVGELVPGSHQKNFDITSTSIWFRDQWMEWITGCTFNGGGYKWHNNPGYIYVRNKVDGKLAATQALAPWIKPILVRREDTGVVMVYNRALTHRFTGDFDTNEWYLVPEFGNCVAGYGDTASIPNTVLVTG